MVMTEFRPISSDSSQLNKNRVYIEYRVKWKNENTKKKKWKKIYMDIFLLLSVNKGNG